MVEYVDSNAVGLDDGTSWTDAWPTIKEGVEAAAVGEDVRVSSDHADPAPGANVDWFSSGTAAAPIRLISTEKADDTYKRFENIQFDSSGGVYDLRILGFLLIYGTSFKIGDDFRMDGNDSLVQFDDCNIELTSVQAKFLLGANAATNYQRFINTDINFSGGGGGCGFNIAWSFSTHVEWFGGTLSISGTQPGNLFFNPLGFSRLDVAGVDLSACTSVLVNVTDDIIGDFHHCLLNSGVSLVTGTPFTTNGAVLFSGCDDTTGNHLYRMDYFTYYGDVFVDDATKRTGGATDPDGNLISWMMDTNANASPFSEPLISPPIIKYIKTTGAKTAKFFFIWDSVPDLKNDEISVTVEYLNTTSGADTKSVFKDTLPADIYASNEDVANESIETWTVSPSMTDENQQVLSIDFTVNRVGPVIFKVHLAKADIVIFLCPKVEISDA